MGHAYSVMICDILARYNKLTNKETYFLTGLDENTGKVVKVAVEKGIDVQKFLDDISVNFIDLYKQLNIEYSDFIRTTDKNKHWPGAIKTWNDLMASGDLYKGTYTGLYCVGCEAFYTEKDLIDGKCPIHLTVPEKIEEQNYFFKLSKYTEKIKEKIKSDELRIIPESRKNEILALLDRGLEDVSFSRPIKAVPHGIPVPGDPEQVIYVWCDALVNYISGLGYGGADDALFKKFWPASVHIIGKDILRFHAAIWPAMLMSVKLDLPENILVHGLITSGGHKMSKSLGNIIDPQELITEYGVDAVRYYLARKISPFDDGDLTKESFKEVYNADLANGLGNLVSRVMKMAETNLDAPVEIPANTIPEEYHSLFKGFEINKAADLVWKEIGAMDLLIQEKQPFKLVKTDKEAGQKIISDLVVRLYNVARMLHAILPETSDKIRNAIKSNKPPEKPLFLRKD